MPGADAAVTRILALQPTVKRTMLYLRGCFSGGTDIRLAKAWAENNKDARVLTIICEMTCIMFRGPGEKLLDNLVASAVFGDGASALIIGSDPTPLERPIYEIHWSGEMLILDTAGAIAGVVNQFGFKFRGYVKDLPGLICKNIKPILDKALSQMTGSPDWSDLFSCVHPGSRDILEGFESKLGSTPEKSQVSRDIM